MTAFRTYVFAFIAGFIASLINGVLWNLVLFKTAYHGAAAGLLRETPVFPIGFAAITLNLLAIITVFSWLYPAAKFRPGRGIIIVALLWTPNLVNSIATAAKFSVVDPGLFIALEVGFSGLNAVVLGLLFSFLFARQKAASQTG